MGTGWDLGETVSPRKGNTTGSGFRTPLIRRLSSGREEEADRVQSVWKTKTPFGGMLASSTNASCQLCPLALIVGWFPQIPGSVVTVFIVRLNSIHEQYQAADAFTLTTALLRANTISR